MAKTTSKTDGAKTGEPDFEAALSRLEKIVEKLDDGNLPLAESLALFKEGTKLAKRCRELLEHAELAVKEALQEEQRDEQSEDSQDQP